MLKKYCILYMKKYLAFLLFIPRSSINSSFFINSILYHTNTIYKYRSYERKYYKKIMNYSGNVQDHHCIPQQFRNHPLIQELAYDIDIADNLRIMPTKKGIIRLKLNPKTLVHDGGHIAYNKYVGKQLTIIYKEPTLDMKKYKFWLFLSYIKKNMQFNKDKIPWK